MKKWVIATISIALILGITSMVFWGGTKRTTILEQIQLDGERIEKIEAYFINEYAPASYSSIDEIQPWVTFLNSLEISYKSDGFPTASLPPTTITIYYTNGKQDVIDYGYSYLYYNEEFYNIGNEYRDYYSDEYRDYTIKNHKILDELLSKKRIKSDRMD